MIEVTDAAYEKIAEFFKDKQVRPIRVLLNSGGWGGPSLALVLDEPNESDEEFKVNGFSFIANKDFLAQASPIKIDFNGFGFAISSAMQMDFGGASCGTGGSACSC